MKKLFCGFLLMLLFCTFCQGAELTFEWTPSTTATGYRLYYGMDRTWLDHSIDTGQLTVYTVSGLLCNTTYFFNVKAYNTAGESDPTNTLECLTDACPAVPEVPDGWTIDSLVLKPE